MYRRIFAVYFVLMCLLPLAACTAPTAAQAPATGNTGVPTALAATNTQAILSTAGSGSRTLTVFAAASLTESFTELGKQFEADHAGVRVLFNFAGSQQLRAQMEQGAAADVFASANTKEMTGAIAASLVVSGTQKTFARNRLIVIFPKDNRAKVQKLADLARPGLKLDIADKAVPVGQYTLDMLDKMSNDPAYGSGFAEKIAANVVSREDNVKSVVSKVQLGEVDAGVVYATDVTGDAAKSVGTLQVTDAFNQVAIYPIAALAKAAQPDLAAQFVQLVVSTRGQQVLARYGFIAADGQ